MPAALFVSGSTLTRLRRKGSTLTERTFQGPELLQMKSVNPARACYKIVDELIALNYGDVKLLGNEIIGSTDTTGSLFGAMRL